MFENWLSNVAVFNASKFLKVNLNNLNNTENISIETNLMIAIINTVIDKD